MRLTQLDFIAQTRSRYLEESFKDIDTVRNMVAGCGLFFLEVYRSVWCTREQKCSVNLHCKYRLNVQVACTPSMNGDI